MLPIGAVIPELKAALNSCGAAVLQAPPGAGKTTVVPLELLNEAWLGGRKIVMLEPRRLAARAAAQRLAENLGEEVGQTVGYRIRLDTKVGPTTRIEVVTEGILTRLLQSDPELQAYGLVIFDEFHERSLHADTGLAFTLESRAALREDLRLLVMSATLDGGPVAELLSGCPLVTSEGRAWPVETRYLGSAKPGERLETRVAAAVRQALREESGSILVFLPGEAEIRRSAELLTDAGARVCPLYGSLSRSEQDQAIAPAPDGRRKVVLATSIAETSLTIEGIRVVIDSGLRRAPRFAPASGMSRLETYPVSQAASEQRRGRAGRLEPGVCYRLWSEAEQARLKPFSAPEILNADLAPLALELARWGALDPAELSWLDAPPPAAYSQARSLLVELEALDERGRITPKGQQMAELPLHPRLGHMLLNAGADSLLACDIAALLQERDILRERSSDLRLRLDALSAVRSGGRAAGVDLAAARRVVQLSADLARRLKLKFDAAFDVQAAGRLLALAYPDRIGWRRAGGAYQLSGSGGAVLNDADGLWGAEYLAVAETDGQAKDARIYLAAELTAAEIEEVFKARIATLETFNFDSGRLSAVRVQRLGNLVLNEEPINNLAPAKFAQALIDLIRRERLLRFDESCENLRQRAAFARANGAPELPAVDDEKLYASLDDWLSPYLKGVKRIEQIELLAALKAIFSYQQIKTIDDLAPERISVPGGSNIRIDYGGAEPVLNVRLQELFGQTETPRIAAGRVALTLNLLSPAGRPVQVTRDLASFWRNTYAEVKKDLKGRYPKHYWPDDPLTAQPTNRAKPRR